MNRRYRTVVVALVPLLLGAAKWFGTNHYRWYQLTDSGVVLNGTATGQNDDGDQNTAYLCRATCAQVPCSMCHVDGKDRSKETYTVANHQKTYFPRFLVPAKEGYRIGWGAYGGSLLFKNGQYAYVLKDGKVNAVAPSGTLLLNDRRGVPSLVHMPSDPKILR